MGAKGPSAHCEMSYVAQVLSTVWALPVLYDCMTEDNQAATDTSCHSHGANVPPLWALHTSGVFPAMRFD